MDDPRFSPAGRLAPKNNADLAFVMHSLSWLANDGVAAMLTFPGALYRQGAEQVIRQYLVDNDYVDAVIQLPKNIFFGTSITTCILVMRRSKKDSITRSQLALLLGLSQSGIYKSLSFLRKNGYIKRVGSRKTGWWRVLK